MELFKLQKKLVLARRGHKLLKDKQDELIKHFFTTVEEWKKLREEMEEKLKNFYQAALGTQSQCSKNILGEIFINPSVSFELKVGKERIMNLTLPRFQPSLKGNLFDYSPYQISGEMDLMVLRLKELYPVMVKLAEVEKKIELLAQEIEKTRRRVNALEYVLIPDLEETARYIVMRLGEMERADLTRLMKVKKMVEESRR
jgi:V/A-type H+-transporting ATPase subunit D